MVIFRLSQEKVLVERIRNNDRKVLGELYMKYERLVFDQVRRLGGDNETAEDLLHEAIIVLWQKITAGTFVLESKLSTFIVSVVKNKYLNRVRKNSFAALSESDQEREDGNPGILEDLIDQEMVNAVYSAMDKLHEVCRKILIMYYYEQRSLKEIARLLNFANEKVAKSKKYQCKESLKLIIEKDPSFLGE
jgi:RNA polymerase sigma factor (sigma-70 family)